MLGARGAFEVGVVLLAHGGPEGASHTSSLVRDFGIPDGLVVWSRYYLEGGAGAWWFGHGLQPVDWPVGVLGAYSGSGRAWWLGRYPTCPPDALCHGSGDCRSVFAAAPPRRLIGHSSSGPYGEITAKKHALGFRCCCMWLSKRGTPVYCTRKCGQYFVYWPTVV